MISAHYTEENLVMKQMGYSHIMPESDILLSSKY